MRFLNLLTYVFLSSAIWLIVRLRLDRDGNSLCSPSSIYVFELMIDKGPLTAIEVMIPPYKLVRVEDALEQSELSGCFVGENQLVKEQSQLRQG